MNGYMHEICETVLVSDARNSVSHIPEANTTALVWPLARLLFLSFSGLALGLAKTFSPAPTYYLLHLLPHLLPSRPRRQTSGGSLSADPLHELHSLSLPGRLLQQQAPLPQRQLYALQRWRPPEVAKRMGARQDRSAMRPSPQKQPHGHPATAGLRARDGFDTVRETWKAAPEKCGRKRLPALSARAGQALWRQ